MFKVFSQCCLIQEPGLLKTYIFGDLFPHSEIQPNFLSLKTLHLEKEKAMPFNESDAKPRLQ